MKLCSSCRKEKSDDSFSTDRRSKDGLCYYCKDCASEKARQSYNKRKQNKDWYVKYRKGYADLYRERKQKAIELLGGKCVDCQGVFPAVAFDFHHTNPEEKDFNPSKALGMSEETMLKELSKCVLLCSNCHRIRHWHFEGGDKDDRSH